MDAPILHFSKRVHETCKRLVNVYTNMAANNKTQMVLSHDNSTVVNNIQQPPVTSATQPSIKFIQGSSFIRLLLHLALNLSMLLVVLVGSSLCCVSSTNGFTLLLDCTDSLSLNHHRPLLSFWVTNGDRLQKCRQAANVEDKSDSRQTTYHAEFRCWVT